MSNYHFKERKMSLKAKGLLSLMLSLPDDWNYSISGLVSLSKDGKDSVMSTLAELEKFGYLKRDRTTDSKGRFSGVEYNIYEQPQPKEPIADNQNSDNQNEEKQNAENPPLLNTNKINNEFNKELNETNTKGLPISAYASILEEVANTDLRNLYVDYIEMRRNIGSPITERGLKMLIDRAYRLSGFDLPTHIQLLETAIINNWKNVYLPGDMEEPAPNPRLEALKRKYSE
jgi:hypothetical protein